MALGGDKGRDMPGPAPLPAPPVPLSPRPPWPRLLAGTKGRNCRFPPITVLLLCGVLPDIFSLWEASLAIRATNAYSIYTFMQQV